MSWLLVAAIPGLLMLAAIGLARLETGLAGAVAVEITQPARHRRDDTGHRPNVLDPFHPAAPDEPSLPSRLLTQSAANPQFPPSWYANRV